MRLFGLVELTSARAARAREAELAVLRQATGACGHGTSGSEHPPPVARELIVVADRLADLESGLASGRTALEPDGTTAVLRWLQDRVRGLLALCEVAPIADEGVVDFLRHEVVADRPAPRPELVDHIADTVRPGYRWRHELLRAQHVVAYVEHHR